MSELKYARFCPECRKQTFEWECPRCGVKTRRVNLERTIGDGVLLNQAEKNDVEVSRQEIRLGKSKKFANVDNLLEELKEGDKK